MGETKTGRPEPVSSMPDAPETSTQNVSEASVPLFETREITALDGPPADEAGIYEELLLAPPNPIDVRLTQLMCHVEDARRSMLELLRAGHGPECTDRWSRVAAEMQLLLLDLDRLAADLSLRDRRSGKRTVELHYVAWHAPAVRHCVNHDQCSVAIAQAAREGFDLDTVEIGIDSQSEVARVLRGVLPDADR